MLAASIVDGAYQATSYLAGVYVSGKLVDSLDVASGRDRLIAGASVVALSTASALSTGVQLERAWPGPTGQRAAWTVYLMWFAAMLACFRPGEDEAQGNAERAKSLLAFLCSAIVRDALLEVLPCPLTTEHRREGRPLNDAEWIDARLGHSLKAQMPLNVIAAHLSEGAWLRFWFAVNNRMALWFVSTFMDGPHGELRVGVASYRPSLRHLANGTTMRLSCNLPAFGLTALSAVVPARLAPAVIRLRDSTAGPASEVRGPLCRLAGAGTRSSPDDVPVADEAGAAAEAVTGHGAGVRAPLSTPG